MAQSKAFKNLKKFSEQDLYKLLDISIDADEKEIKKAYRKKALTCHPDKNPDNPDAVAEFQFLSDVLELLTDTAKEAYDRLIKAKKEAELRHRELNAKRRKLKEDLEAREREAEEAKAQTGRQNLQRDCRTAEEKLWAEIQRLRKQGSKELEREQELIRQEIQRELDLRNAKIEKEKSELPKLRLKWKVDKHDVENGGYSEQILTSIFDKFGSISCVMVSEKRKGSAIVEFNSVEANEYIIENQIGIATNPLKVEWLVKPVRKTFSSVFSQPIETSVVTDTDYESSILTRMRQAEEGKRLADQIAKEES